MKLLYFWPANLDNFKSENKTYMDCQRCYWRLLRKSRLRKTRRLEVTRILEYQPHRPQGQLKKER